MINKSKSKNAENAESIRNANGIIYKIAPRLRNQLLRLFNTAYLKVKMNEDVQLIVYNEVYHDICPPEAFDDQDYCKSGKCPNKFLCDDLLKIIGKDIDWYGNWLCFRTSGNELEAGIRAARKVVRFLEMQTESIEPKSRELKKI